MKRTIFTLFLICFISVSSVFARHDLAALKIRLFNNAPIAVELNGAMINQFPSSAVAVNSILPGRQHLRVLVAEQRGRNIFHREVFAGYVTFEPFTELHLMVDPNRRLAIEGKYIIHPAPVADSRFQRGHGHTTGVPNHHYMQHAMHRDEFNHLVRMIQRTSFDSRKLQTAKQAVAHNWVSAAQVRDIIQLFAFEESRLEFAKFAFESVVDKSRYYIVYDAFRFSSSVNELERYLQRR